MKWIVVAVVVIIVAVLFRRMNRETSVSFWQQRPEMAFDDFYAQFYATGGLDRDAVRMVLHMIARATDVPATRILPSDRVDDLKPGALHAAIGTLQRLMDTGLAQAAGLQQPASWKADTVDEVIRLLASYYAHMRVSAD